MRLASRQLAADASRGARLWSWSETLSTSSIASMMTEAPCSLHRLEWAQIAWPGACTVLLCPPELVRVGRLMMARTAWLLWLPRRFALKAPPAGQAVLLPIANVQKGLVLLLATSAADLSVVAPASWSFPLLLPPGRFLRRRLVLLSAVKLGGASAATC